MKQYTAYLSMPETPRGQYDEEIDVEAAGPTAAKREAQEIADADYEPGLKVRRVVRQWVPEVQVWSS